MTIEQIIDIRVREVIDQSNRAKAIGDLQQMYRFNTAYHWLDTIRRDLSEANITSARETLNDEE